MISNVGHRDLGAVRPRKMQELIYLMHANIRQNAAITCSVKKPIRPRCPVQSMRTKPCRMHHLADRAIPHQLIGQRDARHLEPFGKVDRPDPPGLSHCFADACQLIETDAARLVCHDVMACLHRAHA